MYLLKLTSVFLLIAWSIGLTAQTPLENDLNTYLEVIAAKKSFSGEVLIAKGDRVIFRRALGKTSIDGTAILKPEVIYRIASITKTFTGTLVAMAEEEDLLAYDDRMGKYIPELAEPIAALTIHQLLTHTSGLPHNEGIENYWAEKSKKEMTVREVISEINKLDLLHAPGAEMKYSSPGYYLLGVLIERVYDKLYQQVLKGKILDPLHMESSGANTPEKLVNAFHLLQEKLVPAPYRNYSMLKGAGDMYATAEDLLKWGRSFFNGRLLGESTLKTVLNNQLPYAYGWFVDADSPLRYYHGGGTWGYSGYLAIYPEEEVSIIILSNVSSLPVKAMGVDIEKMVYGLPFEMPVVQEAIVMKGELLDRYSGTYLSETSEMRLEVKRRGEVLFAQIGGSPAFQIYPKGDHVFFGKKVEVEFTFESSGDQIKGVAAERMGRTFTFKKR